MSTSGPADLVVRFEPDARAWLAERGAALTLRRSRRHGCCGGTAFVPVAEPGRPADPARYRVQRVDGIAVYIPSDMTAGPEPLVIGIDGLWRWQRLRVDGMAITM